MWNNPGFVEDMQSGGMRWQDQQVLEMLEFQEKEKQRGIMYFDLESSTTDLRWF